MAMAFNIRAMPLNVGNKTAWTVCSVDPFSVDMTQKYFEPSPTRPAAKPVFPTSLVKTLAEKSNPNPGI